MRSPQTLDHVGNRAVAQGLDALDRVTVPAVPSDEMGERRAGVEAHHGASELLGADLGGGEQGAADAGTLRGGIAGDAAWIAKILLVVFVILFVVSLILGRRGPSSGI